MKKFFTLFIVLMLLISINNANPQGSGSCLYFNGINNYVLMTNSVLDIANDFTVEGWIKPDPYDTAWSIVWEWTNLTTPILTHMGYVGVGGAAGGALENSVYGSFHFDNGAARSFCTPTGSLNKFEWNHIAMVRTGVTLEIYINGINQNLTLMPAYSNTISFVASTGTTAASNTLIATRYGDYPKSGHGEFDEMRLWNVGRTETEIRDNMCRKLPTTYPSSLTGYWDFNTGTGTTLYDLTSNAINGTLYNMSPSSWDTSGAPIGDASSYRYDNNWTGDTVFLASSANGNFKLSNVIGLATGAHVYRVDAQPNFTNGIVPGIGSNNVYYGTFITDTNTTYDISYDYSNYQSAVSASSNLTLYYRHDNAGQFWNNLNPTNTPNILTENNVSSRNEFILVCTTCLLSTQDLESNSNLSSVFPNPFHNTTTFSLPHSIQTGSTFLLYDVLGKEVKNISLKANTTSFTLERGDLKAGIYFYQLKDLKTKEMIAAGKVVIE